MPENRAQKTQRIRRVQRTAARAIRQTMSEVLRRLRRADKTLRKGADMRSEEDSFGSYTGVCADDAYETPVQDADDL